MRKKILLWAAVALPLVTLMACALLSGFEGKERPPAGSSSKAWQENPGNPVIKMGQRVQYILWNDPSVLKEGNTYRMWLSGGDPRNLQRIVVKVHAASSSDGLSWEIDPKPCLSPSVNPKDWDSLRIETPSVVKVDGTYHLYYSGCDEKNAKKAVYSIGHATSRNGVEWTKDPANPVIVAQTASKHQWGYMGVGEPGVVYNPKDKTFYLYYVSMKFSKVDPTIGHIGVLLAKSTDGSTFTHHVDRSGARALILTRDVKNAISGAWFGYSTPTAFISTSGEFHLFCAFIVAPGGPATARHVTLAHAVSSDGIKFKVMDEKIFEAGKGDWKDQQVRSPTVIEADGQVKMWFAGEARTPHFGAGIGSATGKLK